MKANLVGALTLNFASQDIKNKVHLRALLNLRRKVSTTLTISDLRCLN